MNTEPEQTAPLQSALPEGKKPKKQKKKKTVGQEIVSWLLTLLEALVITALIGTFLAQPIRVKGHSMMNTLQDGEIVLATKPAYLHGDIRRGDVVICRYPDRSTGGSLNIAGAFELTFTHHTLFVKRMIALPGDILEIRAGKVYVNGEYVDETGIDINTPSHDDFGPVLLGEDSYFVMGDNRGNSNDSRRVGAISRDMLVGRVDRVLWPLSKFLQKVN